MYIPIYLKKEDFIVPFEIKEGRFGFNKVEDQLQTLSKKIKKINLIYQNNDKIEMEIIDTTLNYMAILPVNFES